jgi:nucleoside-diphosphate-sugar epimerase
MTSPNRVLVTGAAGFLGRHLVHRLLGDGCAVAAVVRRHDAELEALGSETAGRLSLHRLDLVSGVGDLPERGTVGAMIAAAAVHTGEAEDWRINVRLARSESLIRRSLEIPRMVYVSSQNASFQNRGSYARGKRMAEDVMLTECPMGLTILRPTLIYDDFGNHFVRQLADVARVTRIVPHLGSRSPRLQPVHAYDVARAAVVLIREDASQGPESITLYGGAPIDLRSLCRAVCRACGAWATVPLPQPLLRLIGLTSPLFAETVAELYEEKTAPDGAVKALESRFGGPFRRFGDDLPTILDA